MSDAASPPPARSPGLPASAPAAPAAPDPAHAVAAAPPPRSLAARRRTGAVVAAAAVSAFPLFLLLLILTFARNVVFWDEWDLEPLLRAYHEGGLSPALLLAPHNEHRIVLSRLLFLASEAWFHGHRLPILLAAWGAQCVALWFLASRLRRAAPLLPAGAHPFLLVATSALLFAPAAANIWFWAFNALHVLCTLFFTLSVFVYAGEGRSTAGRLLAAVGFGLLAQFSTAPGLITWPTLVLLSFAVRAPWAHRLALLAAGGVAGGAYVSGLAAAPPSPLIVPTLGDRLTFFFAFLGSVFGFDRVDCSVLVGIVGVALLFPSLRLYARHSRGRTGQEEAACRQMTPWLFLTFLPLASALVGAVGRVALGVDQAIASRYTILSGLFWVAVLVCLALTAAAGGLGERRVPRPVLALAGAALTAGYAVSGFRQASQLKNYQYDIAHATEAVRYGAFDPRLWQRLYPTQEVLRERLPRYRAAGWLPFDRPAEPVMGRSLAALGARVLSTPVQGNFEILEAVPEAVRSQPTPPGFWPATWASGWVTHREKGDLILIVDERQVVQGVGFRRMTFRPDVARATRSPRGFHGGWRGVVHRERAAGRRLTALLWDKATGQARPIPGEKRLTVEGGAAAPFARY